MIVALVVLILIIAISVTYGANAHANSWEKKVDRKETSPSLANNVIRLLGAILSV